MTAAVVVDPLTVLVDPLAGWGVPCWWAGSLDERQARRVMQQHLDCAGPPFGCSARNLACEVLTRTRTASGLVLLKQDTRHASPWAGLLIPGAC